MRYGPGAPGPRPQALGFGPRAPGPGPQAPGPGHWNPGPGLRIPRLKGGGIAGAWLVAVAFE